MYSGIKGEAQRERERGERKRKSTHKDRESPRVRRALGGVLDTWEV